MMKAPKTTIEQWRTLQNVVDQGGYAQAAEYLHRSQSSISYGLTRLQDQLGVKLLQIEGRKAKLTDAGKVLLHRSRQLIDDINALESLAKNLEQGWEPEINLIVDAAFPTDLLMNALKRFAPVSRETQVQLREVVLSGADEWLRDKKADLVIGHQVPSGYLGDKLIDIEFLAVANPVHPLHKLERTISTDDLTRQMQVVISDSGLSNKIDSGWLGAENRWTVTSIETAITAVRSGLGFGWLPVHKIENELENNTLKALPLHEGQTYTSSLYMVFGNEGQCGPATKKLAEIICECIKSIDST